MITPTTGSNIPIRVPLKFIVEPNQGGSLIVSPDHLDFQYFGNGGAVSGFSTAEIPVNSSSGSPLPFIVTTEAPWLNLEAQNNNFLTPSFVTAAVVPGSLAPGHDTSSIVFSIPDKPNSIIRIPVTLDLKGAPPATNNLSISPGSFPFFQYEVEEGENPDDVISINRSSAGSIQWTGTTNASWVILTPSEGLSSSQEEPSRSLLAFNTTASTGFCVLEVCRLWRRQ